VGAFAGVVQGRQVIERDGPSDTRAGFMGGLFIDVGTPASWFDVLWEGYLVQRGGKVDLGTVIAEVEVDYLGFAVLPKARVDLGPVSAFAYAGPAFDIQLRTRAGGELATVYRTPLPQVFGVTAGGGLEIRVGSQRSVRIEFHHNEALTRAFEDTPQEVKHRSTSILLRVGMLGGD
jgi:hypothetical protein